MLGTLKGPRGIPQRTQRIYFLSNVGKEGKHQSAKTCSRDQNTRGTPGVPIVLFSESLGSLLLSLVFPSGNPRRTCLPLVCILSNPRFQGFQNEVCSRRFLRRLQAFQTTPGGIPDPNGSIWSPNGFLKKAFVFSVSCCHFLEIPMGRPWERF